MLDVSLVLNLRCVSFCMGFLFLHPGAWEEMTKWRGFSIFLKQHLAQPGLKPAVSLPLPSKHWNFRHVLPRHVKLKIFLQSWLRLWDKLPFYIIYPSFSWNTCWLTHPISITPKGVFFSRWRQSCVDIQEPQHPCQVWQGAQLPDCASREAGFRTLALCFRELSPCILTWPVLDSSLCILSSDCWCRSRCPSFPHPQSTVTDLIYAWPHGGA